MFTLRNVLTFFHVLCAIVGFGWVLLVGMQLRRAGEIKGSAGAELFASAHKVTRIAEVFIYLTGAFGLAAAFTIPHAFKMKWLSISMAVYIVALVISVGILQPTSRKLAGLYAQAQENAGPELVAAIDAANKRAAAVSGILDLLFVVMLFLMVFQWPG